jgi:hypothetical protein
LVAERVFGKIELEISLLGEPERGRIEQPRERSPEAPGVDVVAIVRELIVIVAIVRRELEVSKLAARRRVPAERSDARLRPTLSISKTTKTVRANKSFFISIVRRLYSIGYGWRQIPLDGERGIW